MSMFSKTQMFRSGIQLYLSIEKLSPNKSMKLRTCLLIEFLKSSLSLAIAGKILENLNLYFKEPPFD